MKNEILIFLIALPIIYLLTYILYRKLESIGKIPKIIHPYTGKRSRQLFNDFARSLIFLIGAIVFLVNQLTGIFLGLLVIVGFHIVLMYVQIREENRPKERYIVEFTEEEISEWEAALERNEDIKGDGSPTSKIVLHDDMLYWGKKWYKRNKVCVKSKANTYLFLQDIKREGSFIVFLYGVMGSPMAKRCIYVPRTKEKELNTLVTKIQFKSKNVKK